MMQLDFKTFGLEFNTPFVTNHGSRTTQRTLVVWIAFNGERGYGECVESPVYGHSIDDHMQVIGQARQLIEDLASAPYPPDIWRDLSTLAQRNTFALCALDEALWDLWARIQQRALRDLWSEDRAQCESSYTISAGEPEAMLRELAAHPHWPIYKLKLRADSNLPDILRCIRAATSARLLLDANCAWTPENCLRNISTAAEYGVEMIEQPLSADAYSAMREITKRSPLPIMADESCVNEEDIPKCVGAFHGINVKLQKCGGPTSALRMIELARAHGMRTMLGCMAGETSVGISHAAQLLSKVEFADIDGAVLLRNDPTRGAVIQNGTCTFPDADGAGISLR